jgi:pimeloyl-ACP methyl ester carboxylesterase
MSDWLEVEHNGVRLASLDYGGTGPSVLMLHGLAGHSGEWAEAAAMLRGDFRIVALDQRGHGRSEREPGDVSRQAFVADVAAVVEELGLAPVVLMGQSMGGNTAFLAAAAHPELVKSVVVIEASPDGPAPELPDLIREWLDSWPVPFAHIAQARAFFYAQDLSPLAWSAGLERREDGLWPTFATDVMVECIADVAARDYWSEWREIHCPVLIVRGERGYFDEEHVRDLAGLLPRGAAVTIRGAGHDVHLDAPERLADELRRFVL